MNKNVGEIQDKIKGSKNIVDYDEMEMRYLQRPIGSALYKGRPRKPESERAKPTDRITCKICGKEYFRSGSAKHKLTKYHILHEDLNKKLMRILLKPE